MEEEDNMSNIYVHQRLSIWSSTARFRCFKNSTNSTISSFFDALYTAREMIKEMMPVMEMMECMEMMPVTRTVVVKEEAGIEMPRDKDKDRDDEGTRKRQYFIPGLTFHFRL